LAITYIIIKVQEALGLSYKSARELNKIIDNSLPSRRPKFQRKEIIVAGESFDVYFRDILQCIQALYSNPEFATTLAFAPERHYADADMTIRVFTEMHTGKWWWATQVSKFVLFCSDKSEL
jgi:Plavaka transposase